MTETRIKEIINILDQKYGSFADNYQETYLKHENAFQLLIATILSAQCTDARVNIVTKELFKRYPDVWAFAKSDLLELEKYIHSTGFYHSKAKHIIDCSKALINNYNSEVPSDIEELIKLPGVGRKTANVIRGNIYKVPSIVVDTHVKRISKRLGLTNETDPSKVEKDLMKKLPEENWIQWNLQIIAFGRQICKAQHPKCDECFLTKYCTMKNHLLS